MEFAARGSRKKTPASKQQCIEQIDQVQKDTNEELLKQNDLNQTKDSLKQKDNEPVIKEQPRSCQMSHRSNDDGNKETNCPRSRWRYLLS
jgi:hypothetical protein